jgi:opacity protein-like surface antigen
MHYFLRRVFFLTLACLATPASARIAAATSDPRDCASLEAGLLTPSSADEADAPTLSAWTLVYSAYTYHYHYSEAHKPVKLLGIEKNLSNHSPYFWGFDYFSNSFGQASTYVYAGRTYRPFSTENKAFIKVTAGVLQGYKDSHKDDIPFNRFGYAPAVVPSLGWNFSPAAAVQINVLGTAGLMVMGSYRFQ